MIRNRLGLFPNVFFVFMLPERFCQDGSLKSNLPGKNRLACYQTVLLFQAAYRILLSNTHFAPLSCANICANTGRVSRNRLSRI